MNNHNAINVLSKSFRCYCVSSATATAVLCKCVYDVRARDVKAIKLKKQKTKSPKMILFAIVLTHVISRLWWIWVWCLEARARAARAVCACV